MVAATLEPPPVAPWMFSGLHYWFDAQDKSTMFTDLASTSLVFADGDNVAVWKDKSSNSVSINNATADRWPDYRPAIINGRSAIEGNADHVLFRATPTITQPVTMYLVAQLTELVAAGKNFVSGGTSTSSERMRIAQSAGPAFFINAGASVAGGSADLAPHVHCAVFNASESTYHIDGVLKGGPADIGSNPLVGVALWGNTGGSYIDAAIGEFTLFTAAHTPLQRGLLERHFRRRWSFQ